VENTTEYRIYVDMDGVLTDLVKAFTKIFGEHPHAMHERLGDNVFYNRYFTKLPVAFWANLPWISGGKRLWKSIEKYKPTILTSPLKDLQNKCRHGKQIWLKRELGLTDAPVCKPSDYAGTGRIIISGEKYKYIYGDPSKCILIDDMKKNILPWKRKGGIGILHNHENVSGTINMIAKILENESKDNR